MPAQRTGVGKVYLRGGLVVVWLLSRQARGARPFRRLGVRQVAGLQDMPTWYGLA